MGTYTQTKYNLVKNTRYHHFGAFSAGGEAMHRFFIGQGPSIHISTSFKECNCVVGRPKWPIA